MNKYVSTDITPSFVALKGAKYPITAKSAPVATENVRAKTVGFVFMTLGRTNPREETPVSAMPRERFKNHDECSDFIKYKFDDREVTIMPSYKYILLYSIYIVFTISYTLLFLLK